MCGLGFRRRFARWSTVALFAAIALSAPGATAQDGFFQPLELGAGVPAGPVVTVSAVFTAPDAGGKSTLQVTADIEPTWHIYSLTQGPGGPVPTSIKVTPATGVTVGKFTAVDKPHAAKEAAFDNLEVETHEGRARWTAPVEFAGGVDPVKLELAGKVFAQACSNVCLPPQDYKFTAKLGKAAETSAVKSSAEPAVSSVPPASNAGPPVPKVMSGPPAPGGAIVGGGPPLPAGLSKLLDSAAAEGSYIPKTSKLKINARLEPSVVTAGSKARLVVAVTPDADWHVYYAIAAPLPASGNQATSLVFTETSGLAGGFLATELKPVGDHVGAEASIPYYEQSVTWAAEIDVPKDAKPGDYPLAGTLGFQTCQGKNCLPPEAVKWETSLTVAATAPASVTAKPVKFLEAAYYRDHVKAFNAVVAQTSTVVQAAGGGEVDLANLQIASDEEHSSLIWMLVVAFGAGFILNFMPCVLPVIGLKVLSFVEQSGNDRKRILMLNVWYALGMLFVFWVLATIPVVLRIGFGQSFGWGQQFSFDGFNITLTAIVFVMALSFLGVWEIPIPGFAGAGSAQKLAEKEGASGAFVKGVITTLLATPCSGPGLATAVGFALRENIFVTYAIFTAMGLGMASPYLAIGAKPSLLKFLPRPGEWMDTFKQIMGFVLLGTVVWLLMSLPIARLIPTITFLFSLWAACWWIGRTPVYAEMPQKLKAWGQATVWSVALGWLAYSKIQGVIDYRVERFVDAQMAARMNTAAVAKAPEQSTGDSLAWRHFSIPALQETLAGGQTVMIDFTADWCATCKFLKGLYLDVPETKKLVEELGVVTFEADMTSPPADHADLLRKLNQSGSVPVIAIFPADRPNEPIVFANGYTQTQILEALRKAGPSKLKSGEPKVSMR